MIARRTSAALAICAALAAGVFAGCGGGGDSSNADVGPAAAVPADTPIYLDATIKPTGSAEVDARAAMGKLLDTTDPGAKIASLVEKASNSGGHGINFDQDVRPWLGEKAGVFFTNLSGHDTSDDNTDGTVILETTDPAAALAAARKEAGATATSPAPQSYNGSSYQSAPDDDTRVFGTVGNFLVEGTVEGFKAAVDADNGDSLGDDSDFKDSLDQLPADRLGTFYTVPKTLIDSIGSEQFDQQSQAILEKTSGQSLEDPVAGALTASASSFDLQLIGGDNGVETPESSLVADVPGDSWLAFGLGNLGDSAKHTLEQLKDSGIPDLEQGLAQVQQATGASIDQLTGALGDAVLYVRGTTEPTLNGALVVQTKDPDLTGRLLNQLQSLVQLGSGGGVKPLKLNGGGTGFQLNDPTQTPQPIEFAQQGDKLVIGYGANSAEQSLAPAQKLSDSPTFSTARGQVSDLGTDFFLDLPKVFKLAESTGAKSDPGYLQARPYLDALTYLVTGSGSKGDQAELKAVVGLK
jgi:hypothetical protein